MLEWDYPAHSHPSPFTKAVRNTFVKGALASLKSFMVTISCKPEMPVGTAGLPEFSESDGILWWQGSSSSIQLTRKA